MKTEDLEREARKVLEPLRCSPVGVSSPRQVQAGRSELVPHLARIIEKMPAERAQLQERQRRWQHARWVLGATLAMAAAGMVWLAAPGTPTASAPSEPARLQLVSGRVSQKGTELHTGVKYAIDSLGRLSTPRTSGARFVTDAGVDLGFGADATADLSFTPARQHIALNRGRVELSVPKLKQGTSLSVATPDAVVTVHGTRFSVEVMPEHSCVRVHEGVVSVVRGETRERLTGGQSSGCEPALTKRLGDETPAPIAEGSGSNDQNAERPKPKGTGTLVQENRLFQSALRSEQSGDRAQALALATRLLTRYPNSVMAPEARRLVVRVREHEATSSSSSSSSNSSSKASASRAP
ncbi:MAG TPA: FecR domain-containing protein [Polyangiaceae bacterium]|nr:FecR domain-containing protein [Polyangiaceae bacterium]